MTSAPAGAPAPAREARDSGSGRWVAPSAVVAILLAGAGAAASLWRPLAQPVETAVTDLDAFLPGVVTAAAAFRWPRYAAAAATLALTVATPLAIIATGSGRRLLGRVAGRRAASPWRAAAVGAAIAVATSLVTLPLAWWTGYVHLGRWGFSTQGLAGWLRDWVIVNATGWLVAAVVAAALMALVVRRPATWHWWVVPLGTGLTALLVVVSPVVSELVIPTRPLDESRLPLAARTVLAAAGTSDVPILVGAASRRTTMVNAFVSGLGPTHRIVLWDTLLELEPDKVAAVLAHELAHAEHGDIWRGVLLAAAGLLPTALALRRAFESGVVARWLAPRGRADPRLIAVAAVVVVVAQVATLPVANLVSRRAEAAADERAIELTGNAGTLIATTRLFTVKDLAQPSPPAWTRQLWGTHPSVAQRIRAAVATAERLGLPLPTLARLRDGEHATRHPAATSPRGCWPPAGSPCTAAATG